MNIQINRKNIFSRFSTLGGSGGSSGSNVDLSGYIQKWEDWDSNLNVSGITTGQNFVFTGLDGGSGGGSGGGSSVTAISFTGRTLTLSQSNISDLTATFNLTENDIPNLSASKITSGIFDVARIPDIGINRVINLQTALDGKLDNNITLTFTTNNGLTGGQSALDLSANRSWTFGLTGQALALHNLSTNGFIVRTGAGTVAARTITGGTGISITNGNGVSGNPTINFDNSFGDGRYVTLATNQTITGLKDFTQFVTSTNFVFTGLDGGSGGGSGGTTVTAISFTGRTLTLSQNNVSDLTATFNLTENDIPNLPASKITSGIFDVARIPDIGINRVINLQTALDGKVDNTITVNSGTGLTGGGDLTTNRTLSLTGQALALHNLATNGIITRTGAGTVAARTITGGTGISITNGNGVSGNPTISSTITQYTDALARASISLTTTGTSGASTYSSTTGVINVPNYTLAGLGGVPTGRTITINGTTQDLSANRTWNVGTVTSISGNNGITGTVTTTGNLGLTGQALALHNLATNGLIARTGTGTVAGRTITGSTSINVTNGNGVSGNPTLSAIFGTTSGTVAQGNDSRILNGQTAFDWGDYRQFGLGTNSISLNDVNLELIPRDTGFYRSTSITNSAGQTVGLFNIRFDISRNVQFGAGSANTFIGRSWSGANTWSNWVNFWHSGNLPNPIQGTGTAGQVSFWTGAGTQSGDSGLVWNNSSKNIFIGSTANPSITVEANTSSGGSGNPFIELKRTTLVGLKLEYFPNLVGRISATAADLGLLEFYTGANTLKWSILANGIFQSNGAQTIQTNTGNLTLATGGGNGNILLSPNGTGAVLVGTTSPLTGGGRLQVNGVIRSNNIMYATNFVFG